MSIRVVGPTEVGLVMKRFALRKLKDDNPIAFHGEAGYQADLLMPGRRWKPWLLYEVDKCSLGAGSAGRNRCGHRPGGRAAADRREVGGLQEGVRQFLRSSLALSRTAGRRASSARCFLRGRWRQSIPSAFSSSPRARSTVCPMSPELRSRAGEKRDADSPEAFGSAPGAARAACASSRSRPEKTARCSTWSAS